MRQAQGAGRGIKGVRRAKWRRCFSAQKRTLEVRLEPCAQAGGFAAGNIGAKGGAQMREGVQERVSGLAGRRRAGCAHEQHAQRVRAQAQAFAQAVEGFEGEGGAQRLGGTLEGQSAEQPGEQSRERGRVHAVAGQHRAKVNAKSAPATALARALRAIHALAARHWLATGAKALAREAAVAVERAVLSAMRAALQFQGKSAALKACSSLTKRGTVGFMGQTHKAKRRSWREPKMA